MKMRFIVIIITVILCIAAFTFGVSADEPLTPDGNMTLVDDVMLEEKQFITVQSRNGDFFYIIIDRSGENGNVYFLNLVDEADLVALVGEDAVDNEITEQEISNPDTDPVPDADTKKTGSSVIVVMLIAVIAGGGAFYYFKFIRNKAKKQDSDDNDMDMDDADAESSEKDEN